MDYTQMKLAESSDNSTGGNFFTTGRGTNQETPPNAGGESGLNPLDFPKTGTSSPPYEGPSEKGSIVATMPPEIFPPDQTNASPSYSEEDPAALDYIKILDPASPKQTGADATSAADSPQNKAASAEADTRSFKQDPNSDPYVFYERERGKAA